MRVDGARGTRDGLVKHFGSLVTSMNTLFRSISGGVTWEGPAYSLEHIGVEWVLGFTFYVAFCCFAVLNEAWLSLALVCCNENKQDWVWHAQIILQSRALPTPFSCAMFLVSFGLFRCALRSE